ncbi:MAG: CDP-diacylglycerol--serine O-phosphatidyltransferase [Alphaproteobacteria bacterium]|jgi:CDP-diacylglycerol--serine O-phosphatidyltransferase|nr:CDP-diacylglycerol--serine O-phosphatidyltransferase [Candidatus Jidaibacter sp.]
MQLKNRNISAIHISKLLPSFVTILALCLGITSIRYAIDLKWNVAAALIVIAAILDAIDGRLARLLNASSNFGAQLDSIADIVSFGVAPAIVMYFWSLHSIPYKGIGWAVVLLFIACSALRLARFNSCLDDESEKKKLQNFFTGVPMPAGAVLAILPMISTIDLMPNIYSHWFIAFYIGFVAALMISNLPTFSFKKVYIERKWLGPTFAMIATLIGGLILEPWFILPFLGILYLISIPISLYVYFKQPN